RDRAGVRRLRVPHPIGAPAVRPAHRVAQGDRIARLHAVDRARARSRRAAAHLRVAGVAGRGADRAIACGFLCPLCPCRETVIDPVLVTGATGFTGGHLARSLAARGHRVRALVRDRASASDLAAAGIELADGDVRDAAALARAAAGVDVIYHIAAIYR